MSAVERFNGILFDRPHSIDLDKPEEPACFGDLHLDQVLASMTAGREDYDLKPFFYTPLHEAATVRYRHEVARDLEKPEVLKPVRAFAEQMRRMREHLAQARKRTSVSRSSAVSHSSAFGRPVLAMAASLTYPSNFRRRTLVS